MLQPFSPHQWLIFFFPQLFHSLLHKSSKPYPLITGLVNGRFPSLTTKKSILILIKLYMGPNVIQNLDSRVRGNRLDLPYPPKGVPTMHLSFFSFFNFFSFVPYCLLFLGSIKRKNGNG